MESPANGRKPEIRKQGMSERARECEEHAAASHALHGNHCDASNSHRGADALTLTRVKLL